MSGELEKLLIRLEADTTQLRRALAQADSAVGSFSSSADKRLSSTERRFQSMARTFNTAVAGMGIVSAVRATAALADQYQNMENRLNVVAKSAGDLELSQRRLMQIADETRVGVGDTAELYARYSFAMKDAGKTTNEMLEFTAALQKAVVVSGASTAEASGALRQFSQGLAAGQIRGQELNSVMEQMPIIADLIARKLGVTTGELRKLAEQGAVTSEVAFQAVMDGLAELDARFKKTSPTIGQSLNQMTTALLDLGEASGVFEAITKAAQDWTKMFKYTSNQARRLGLIKDDKAPVPDTDRFSFGAGMQGNIRPPVAKGANNQDPWAASIIPPSAEAQLAEMKAQWDEIHEVQLRALGDLVGNKTETAATKMQALTDAVKQGAITWRDFGDMQQEVKLQTADANDAMLSSTSNFLDTMFANNKTAATASALVNTYQGITKALASYPPPYSYAMASMQAAMGFAQVRAIQSTSKRSTGGGGRVAGGGGAPAAAQSGPSQSSSLFVRGIGFNDLLTGDSVKHLAERLLDFQRDGGKVVLG